MSSKRVEPSKAVTPPMLLKDEKDDDLVVEALVHLRRQVAAARTGVATFKRLTPIVLVVKNEKVAKVAGHHRIKPRATPLKAFLT